MMRAPAVAVLAITMTVSALAALTVSASAATFIAQGKVVSVTSCSAPAGYLFAVGTSSNTFIFRPGITKPVPLGVTPHAGQSVFVVASDAASCTIGSGASARSISGKLATYFSSSTPASTATTSPVQPTYPAQTPGGGTGDGSSFLSQMTSLLQSLFDRLGATALSTGRTTGDLSNVTASRFNFGGPVSPVLSVLPCDPTESTAPPGSFIVKIGPPNGGEFIYNPSLTRVFMCGPPLVPGQNALGSYTPTPMICDTCQGPHVYCPKPSIGFMNMNPGVGTSGCAAGAPSMPPVTPGQCPQSGFSITNDATKQVAETAVRQALSQCSGGTIRVVGTRSGSAACGYNVNGVAAGCTDVSGLQCGTMNDLCKLASMCGGFNVTGGSEAGHSAEHSSGNATDIQGNSAFDSCLIRNFRQVNCPAQYRGGGGCWLDSSTGTIYWQEPAVGTQGAHWHVCHNGYCRI